MLIDRSLLQLHKQVTRQQSGDKSAFPYALRDRRRQNKTKPSGGLDAPCPTSPGAIARVNTSSLKRQQPSVERLPNRGAFARNKTPSHPL
ncbi:unnamed protein product [Lampetra fluviatilis]